MNMAMFFGFGILLFVSPNFSAGEKSGIDLFPGKNFQGWQRVPLDGDKLSAKNPWKVDAKAKILQCDGVGIKEMFLYKRPFKNGIFHVEWRFRKVKGKSPEYNSGVYVRSSKDGKQWLQTQTAMVPKPPQVADLFGDLPVKGKIKRVVIHGKGLKNVNPPGEWNTYDILCQGKKVQVKLNGKVVTTMKNCPRLSGHVGLQAEFFFIEFKNIRWKQLRE